MSVESEKSLAADYHKVLADFHLLLRYFASGLEHLSLVRIQAAHLE